MGRSFARLLALAAFLFSYLVAGAAGVRSAWAASDDDDHSLAAPRDVALVVQPASAPLPPVPADFQRIQRGFLTLEFPASVRDRAEALAEEAEEFRARVAEDLGQAPLDRAWVRVTRSPEQMAELAPVGAPPPPYAAGVAYPAMRVALLAMQAPGTWEAPDLAELLRHELAHLALADAISGHDVPRWFNEGLAIYESREAPWARRKTLAEASFAKHLLPLDELDRGFAVDSYAVNVAYAESASLVGFLLRDADKARFGSLIERVRSGAAFDRALEDAYGIDLRKLEFEWREEVSRHFSVVPALTGGGLVWLLTCALAGAAWLKRRRRAKVKLAQWAREEAEMEAQIAAASRPSAPISAIPVAAEDEMPSGPTPGIPVVEHQGRWYTVH